jgi:hypothetical protein
MSCSGRRVACEYEEIAAGTAASTVRWRRHLYARHRSAMSTSLITAHLERGAHGLGRGVGRALGVGTDRGVGVGLGVAVGVGVTVGVAVGVGVTVGVGVGVGPPDGETWT